mgnify:CR=1 FL=1
MSKSSSKSTVEAYHPEKSRISDSALAEFIRAPITGELSEVPGIGPATVKVLTEAGVETTFALIGVFLTLKNADTETVEHMDQCYYWPLSLSTVTGYRAGICQAIAEKTNTMFPNIYDRDVYCQD